MKLILHVLLLTTTVALRTGDTLAKTEIDGQDAAVDGSGRSGGSPPDEDAPRYTAWLTERHKAKDDEPRCFVIDAFRYGLGCMLNNLMVFTGTSILENPSTIVYYDHTESAYACSEPAQLESFTALTPPLSHFRTTLPPPGKAAECVRMHFRDTVIHNRAFTRRLRNWVHAAPTHTDILARNSAAVRSLLGVVCPFVRSMWNGLSDTIRSQVTAVQREASPDLSEPYIVIQARGGDKVREVDIHAEGYDMLMGKGMAQLVQRHGHVVLGLPCVVVGDDHQLAVRIGERAEQVLRCSRVVLRTPGGGRTAHEQKQFNDLPLEERCASTNAVLADMDIMASAPYFVGMSISNVAVVAFYARSCVYYHDRSTYADGGGELVWSYFV